MDAVRKPALIEVLDAHGRIRACHRLSDAGDRCVIGRNLQCDLVLDDPFAATDHTSLTLLDDGRISISDLGSRNGTRVHASRSSHLVAGSEIIADAHLVIGRTRVRVRTSHETLAPERVFRRDTLQRHRTVLAVVGLVAVLALAAGNEWLRETDQVAVKALTAMLVMLNGLGVWIGFWSLLTRIGHGAWNARVHAAIACNAFAIGAAGFWLFNMTAFATQWSWLGHTGEGVAACAAIVAIYLHMRVATQINIRVAASIATVVPVLFGGCGGWVYLQNETRNVNHIDLGADVFPEEIRLTHGADLNAYLATFAPLKREANLNRQQSLADTPLTVTR